MGVVGMLARSIKTALAELAGAPGFETVRACLDRVSASLIQTPKDAVALVLALGHAEDDDKADDDLLQILSAALDGARMTQEKGQARGGALIAALEAAVAQLGKDASLTMPGRLALSRAWLRAGLVPPTQLALSEGMLDDVASGHDPVDPSQLDAMIDDMFGDLIGQAEGDVAAVHAALSEMLPSLPAEAREMLITAALARPGGMFGRLGCAFLLDPTEGTRLAAAQGLAARLAAGHLEAEVAAQLVILRSWLPEDAARARLDSLLRDAMRRGVSGGAVARPWQVHKVLATLPDGTGSQSIGVSVQTGSRRALAMLLLKQDFGVKDAYMIPCTSATEQRKILTSLEAKTGALQVSPDYLHSALELALADGLAHGLPPTAGLIEIAEVCGLTGLRPQDQSTPDLLTALDPQARLSKLSPQARGKLINASEFWCDDHPLTNSWFEDSDTSRSVLDTRRAPRAMEAALWTWLETRREWWARIMTRSALLLQAAGHEDVQSFVATARSLLEGRALRNIPIMLDIHDTTIGAWLHGDDGGDDRLDPDIGLQILDDADNRPPMPAPEKKGELGKLLKDTDLSPEWIDGYLAAICIAPKMISPDRWIQPVLRAVLSSLNERSLQRFLNLLMHRNNAALAVLAEPKSMERALRAMASLGQSDWSEGFLAGKQSFKPCWPAKSLGESDKAVLRQIEAMADDPATSVSAIPGLALWLSARLKSVLR
jgi:hypothetical protein